MLLGEKPAALLVVGTGGGNELSAWGPSNPKWMFTGVDPSEEMLEITKNKAVQLGLETALYSSKERLTICRLQTQSSTRHY